MTHIYSDGLQNSGRLYFIVARCAYSNLDLFYTPEWEDSLQNDTCAKPEVGFSVLKH